MACQRAVRFSMFFCTTRVGVCTLLVCSAVRKLWISSRLCTFAMSRERCLCSLTISTTPINSKTKNRPCRRSIEGLSKPPRCKTNGLPKRETVPQPISSAWHSSPYVIVHIFLLVHAMSIFNRQKASRFFEPSTVSTYFRTFLYATHRVQRRRDCQSWCIF